MQTKLSVVTAAALTLKVSRHRARRGDRVIFTGTILGEPLPKQLPLDIQGKVPGQGWRTAVSPTAHKGKFKSKPFRFLARASVTYSFRARLRKQNGYPYTTGYSPIVKVRLSRSAG